MANLLTWDDLANLYGTRTGGKARTRPMETIYNWALTQSDIKETSEGLIMKGKERTMKLYEYADAFRALAAMAEDDGELNSDIQDEIDKLEMNESAKVENICRLIRSLEADGVMFAEEAARLKHRSTVCVNRINHLKNYLLSCLTLRDLDSYRAGLFTVQARKSPPSVKIADGAELPEPFVRIKRIVEPDKSALLLAWKEGKELPTGVSVAQERHVRIL